MRHKGFILVAGIIAVAVACSILGDGKKKTVQGETPMTKVWEDASLFSSNKLKIRNDPSTPEAPSPDEQDKTPSAEPPVLTEPEPLTHYDTKALDAAVRKDAERFGDDEKTHEMLVKMEANGTVIYRQIGMHVIVNKNGERYYLPDEI